MNRRNVLTGSIGAAALFGTGTGAVHGTSGGESGSDDGDPSDDGAGGPAGGYDGSETLAPPGFGGFDRSLVYVAEGLVETNFIKFDRDSWERYHTDVFGRSQAELESLDSEVAAFAQRRFGLSFANVSTQLNENNIAPSTDGSAVMRRFAFDPETNYRAMLVSGERVSEDGGTVRDGGHLVVTTEETELGGTFAEGRSDATVPAGSLIANGKYNILFDTGEPLVIDYASRVPIVSNPDSFTFKCDLSHPEWGSGLANGLVVPDERTDDGRLPVHIRNFLSFPGLVTG